MQVDQQVGQAALVSPASWRLADSGVRWSCMRSIGAVGLTKDYLSHSPVLVSKCNVGVRLHVGSVSCVQPLPDG